MNDLQGFFESTTGKGVSIAVILVLLLIIFLLGRPKENQENVSRGSHNDTMSLTLSALLISASFVLSNIKLFVMPQGGSVTPFSMLPIAVCAYLLGTRTGVMAGAALGLVNLIVNPYVIHPMQLLIDYPIAFSALGFGGPLRNTKAGLPGVYLVGIFGRFVFSTLSGVVFFASYAEGTGMNPFVYSVVYNGSYIGAEGLITLIILLLPPVKATFEKIKENLN